MFGIGVLPLYHPPPDPYALPRMPDTLGEGMISSRVERRRPKATEEEVLVIRIDSVRHAADRTKDGVRHAAEVMAPYAGTAKDNAATYAGKARTAALSQYDAHLAPRVGQTVTQARANLPPRVEQAVSTAAKRTRETARDAADYAGPRVGDALVTVRTATAPAREEAAVRGAAAMAALRGHVTAADIDKLARRRVRRARNARIARRIALIGVVGGAGVTAWKWWNTQANPDWLVEPGPSSEVTGRSSLDGAAPVDALAPEAQARQTEAESKTKEDRQQYGDTYP
jgi:hypothetical protein